MPTPKDEQSPRQLAMDEADNAANAVAVELERRADPSPDDDAPAVPDMELQTLALYAIDQRLAALVLLLDELSRAAAMLAGKAKGGMFR